MAFVGLVPDPLDDPQPIDPSGGGARFFPPWAATTAPQGTIAYTQSLSPVMGYSVGTHDTLSGICPWRPQSEFHVWDFTGTLNDVAKIVALRNMFGLDLVTYLFNSDFSQMLAQSDDTQGSLDSTFVPFTDGSAAIEDYTLPYTGTYHIVVCPFDGLFDPKRTNPSPYILTLTKE